eukprot:12480548-Ditylum_brightwellii.AAC.2
MINNKLKQHWSCAIDMRSYWPIKKNLGDCITKYQPGTHHKLVHSNYVKELDHNSRKILGQLDLQGCAESPRTQTQPTNNPMTQSGPRPDRPMIPEGDQQSRAHESM